MKYAAIALVGLAIVTVAVLWLRKPNQKRTLASQRPMFKMPIDDVFSLKTPGSVVVVGVVSEGEVRPGDALVVQTSGGDIGVQVRAMETYPSGADRSIKVERASAGQRVGIILNGINKAQVKPLDLLVTFVNGTARQRPDSSVTTAGVAASAKTQVNSHAWRTDPRLAGQFHPDFPDDLQVIVHDGGPRLTKHQPEIVWVRISNVVGTIFTGQVLNAPTQLTTVHQNQEIHFLASVGSKHPILVTEKYLAERGDWIIRPCSKCGFDELFDAPSDLMKAVFPDMPPAASMEMFTSFCPLCGGVQGVQSRSPTLPGPADKSVR